MLTIGSKKEYAKFFLGIYLAVLFTTVFNLAWYGVNTPLYLAMAGLALLAAVLGTDRLRKLALVGLIFALLLASVDYVTGQRMQHRLDQSIKRATERKRKEMKEDNMQERDVRPGPEVNQPQVSGQE